MMVKCDRHTNVYLGPEGSSQWWWLVSSTTCVPRALFLFLVVCFGLICVADDESEIDGVWGPAVSSNMTFGPRQARISIIWRSGHYCRDGAVVGT